MPWMYFFPTCEYSGRYWSWVHPKSQIWRKHQEILYHITKRFSYLTAVSRTCEQRCIHSLYRQTMMWDSFLLNAWTVSLFVCKRKTENKWGFFHRTHYAKLSNRVLWKLKEILQKQKKILCGICGADSAYFQVEMHSAKKQLVHLSNDVCKRNTCVGYRFTQSGWHTQTHAAVF